MTDMEVDPNVSSTSGLVPLEKLLSYFQDLESAQNERELEETIFSIKNSLAGSAGLRQLLSQELRPYLYRGLKHSNPQIRYLTLTELIRCTESPATLSIMEDENLWQIFYEILLSEDIGNADRVGRVLIKISDFEIGRQMIFHNNNVTQLKKAMNVHENVKFRVLDIFASIAGKSIDLFNLCKTTPFLQDIIQSYQVDDILQKLNVIELLEKLSVHREGVSYLEQQGIFRSFQTLLEDPEADPFSSLLLPKIVQFISTIASKEEAEVEVVEKHSFVPTLKKLLEENSLELKEAIVIALGAIGSSREGLSLLFKHNVLEEILPYLHRENLRVSALRSVALLLKRLATRSSPEVDEILEKHLTEISHPRGGKETIMIVVMPFVDLPFPEIRFATYDVLVGLLSHPWGVRLSLGFAGFYEWLLNRNSDESKEGKEWKYLIVQTLAKTAEDVSDLLEKQKQVELRYYLKSGVFFVSSEARVEIATRDIM